MPNDRQEIRGDNLMPSYWWECESCGKSTTFSEASNSQGIVHFIRDILAASNWDQTQLQCNCKHCGKKSLRITYEFPRKDKEKLRVVHLIGLGSRDEFHLPMMWETYPLSDPKDRWFDFKYVDGRNIFGLTKPAVLDKKELQRMFELYRKKTGIQNFP